MAKKITDQDNRFISRRDQAWAEYRKLEKQIERVIDRGPNCEQDNILIRGCLSLILIELKYKRLELEELENQNKK